MDAEFRKRLAQVLASRTQEQFGLHPFDPRSDKPQDMGLGGISTEYISTDTDQQGNMLNYPTIWYSKDGTANLLSPQEAMQQAMQYEYATSKRFPRFNSAGNAGTFAEHRSAMGGGVNGPLASIFGFRNW
jgi:hypothetical protein